MQLSPTLFLMTPLGEAEAHFLWRDSDEAPYKFGCFQCETKEFWVWPNHQVRLLESVSAARSCWRSPIYLNDEVLDTLGPHLLRHKKAQDHERALKREKGVI